MIRILGIDPSLRCTGYGVVDFDPASERVTLIEGGVIRTASDLPLTERLLLIHTGIAEVLDEFQPACVAVEDLFTRFKHPRTAILMGHARGALLLACAQCGVAVIPYAPRLVKNAMVGSGAAKKPQIQIRVRELLGVQAPLEPNDVADALALALTHIQRELRRGHVPIPVATPGVAHSRQGRRALVQEGS